MEKSLLPIVNVFSQESSVENYSWSLSPLSFRKVNPEFSKIDKLML